MQSYSHNFLLLILRFHILIFIAYILVLCHLVIIRHCFITIWWLCLLLVLGISLSILVCLFSLTITILISYYQLLISTQHSSMFNTTCRLAICFPESTLILIILQSSDFIESRFNGMRSWLISDSLLLTVFILRFSFLEVPMAQRQISLFLQDLDQDMYS